MGTDSEDGKDGERPSKVVNVKSFLIDKYPVTNENFRTFVREKKYKTDAEKFGWSFAFFSAVPEKTLAKIKQSVQVSLLCEISLHIPQGTQFERVNDVDRLMLI